MLRKPRISSTEVQTIKLFLKENWRHKWIFLTACSCWVVGMILQKLVLGLFSAQAIDKLVSISGTNISDYWPVFLPYVITILVVGVISSAIVALGFLHVAKLETRVRASLQLKVFEKLNQHSIRFHADSFSGALVTQTNRFINAYIALTDIFILPILRTFFLVVAAIAILAFYSLPIAAAMLIWTIFFVAISQVLVMRRIPLSKKSAEADSNLTAHLADSLGNVSAIKSFAAETSESEQHLRLSEDWRKKTYRAWSRASINDFYLAVMMVILLVVVLIISVMGVMEGFISLGTLLLAQIYVTQIIAELWRLSDLSKNIERNLSNAAEMTELLGRSIDVTDPPHPKPFNVKKGEIVFSHVDFSHTDKDDALFKDFNFRVSPGERIGLVGHSGSGKTTLTKLIQRFADIDKGSIEIDGQDIRSVRQSDLRSQIAYVPQEPLLFHRSLSENISYGKPDATKNQIIAAAKKARVAEFIDRLPNSYETLVGERGVKLSGGQRQRVAIARAILKDAPILVLDEATSSLDSESEKLIQKALKDLVKNRTVIAVAHRLSTIQWMDRIVVMDNGSIVEEGTHEQLLDNKGVYANLWKHQSGGFLQESDDEYNGK